jgi:hypothetical protein
LKNQERHGTARGLRYGKARRVLSGIDPALCPADFIYGRDGRPFFVRGPADSDERVERVLAILEARVGPKGYGYKDPGSVEDDNARAALLEWLEAEPEEVPRFYRASGMVAALRLAPRPAVPADLMELLWPEGRTWEDEDERAYFDELLEGYWDYVGDLLQEAAAPDAEESAQAIDVWMDEFPEEQRNLAVLAATVEWATGFMAVVEQFPDAWREALLRSDLTEHWEMIRWWAEFIGTGNKDRIADATEGTPPRNIARSARALARALLPPDRSQGG